ncbi:MAG: hypothetical protein ACI92A_002238 [Candidatus Paceibacteria bacterium]
MTCLLEIHVCSTGGLEDWRTGGLEDWRTGGLEDWRTGGLEENTNGIFLLNPSQRNGKVALAIKKDCHA